MSDQQLHLFGDQNTARIQRSFNAVQRDKLLNRFQGALTFSAIGDALGWPTEFGTYPASVQSKQNQKYPLTEYVEWEKRLGGQWWGYSDKIGAGTYSDDTQLGLCVARCLDSQGSFDAERFSYFELPLWLVYEQGGGASVKFAARSFVSSKREWWRNFYRRNSTTNPLDYCDAGANGAAMRVLPIALVNAFDENKLFYESFISAIVTHGHPRAILSTLIYAGAISFLTQRDTFTADEFLEYLVHIIQYSTGPSQNWNMLDIWISEWNKRSPSKKTFQPLFQEIRDEAYNYLRIIPEYLSQDSNAYYKYTGALTRKYKGSGITTVFCAIYLFMKFSEQPSEGLYSAVNMLGSDTDTIANFVGGLYGAYYGIDAVPRHLLDGLQDRKYLYDTASQLQKITTGEALSSQIVIENFRRKDALLRILAWEIGLHEMFWEALAEGDRLTHPSLGPGRITRKEVKELSRDDFEVKLISVSFDCGQTCTFHSRVSKGGKVDESLASDLKRGLGDDSPEF